MFAVIHGLLTHSAGEPSPGSGHASQLTVVWALLATMPILLIGVQLYGHSSTFLPSRKPRGTYIVAAREALLHKTLVEGQSAIPASPHPAPEQDRMPPPLPALSPPAPTQSTQKITSIQQERNRSSNFSPWLQQLSKCASFECLQAAHTAMLARPRPPPFNFPHFYVIGWQKAATTSLFA